MNVVPILKYLSVSAEPPEWIAPFAVSPRAFEDQLDLLLAAQVSVIPLQRLVSAIRGGPPLPPRPVVLTFDEGFADFYWTVAPQLASRELPATLFVATGAIHPPGGRAPGWRLPQAPMINWRQVAGLDAYGIEIGGHSRTHPDLDTLPVKQMRAEVEHCKRDLEEALGHAVFSFSYPHGYSNSAVRRAVRHAGWTSACAGANRFASTADDPFWLPRLTMRHDTTPELFEAWLGGRGGRNPHGFAAVPDWACRLARRSRARLPGHQP